MAAGSRKSLSVIKQWAALILFLGFFPWPLLAALDYYRDYKSIEHAVDVLASECSTAPGSEASAFSCRAPGLSLKTAHPSCDIGQGASQGESRRSQGAGK
jgi:hypothetical protein